MLRPLTVSILQIEYFPWHIYTIKEMYWSPENVKKKKKKKNYEDDTTIYVFCLSRCAGAEISEIRPCCHQRTVHVSVSLYGQRRPSDRAGTVSKENFKCETSVLLPVLDWQFTVQLLSLLESLQRGWLHLQRAAPGRWIHPFPLLTPWISCVSGIKTLPGPTHSPLHSIPTTQEYLGRGECVWTTKQPEIFRRGLWWSSWNGSKWCGQSSVLSGQVTNINLTDISLYVSLLKMCLLSAR